MVIAGTVAHVILFGFATAICAFDGGHLGDWQDCLIPLGALAIPLTLAIYALRHTRSAPATAAGIMALLLAFWSLSGIGVVLLVIGGLYLAGAWTLAGHEIAADSPTPSD